MEAMLHGFTLWSDAAATSLIAAAWQGLVLTALVVLCLRLLPAICATARSLLWMAALLLVALLHLAPMAWPSHLSPGPDHAAAAHISPLQIGPLWACVLAGGWAVLALARLAQLAWSAGRLRRVAQSASPVACQAEHTALLRSGRRSAQLCTSKDVDRPSVIGFRSPRILVPHSLLAELSAPELEQIIRHELEHLRRGDDWTNLLQKLVLALFPLNPALVWIERQLCIERELACDDGVLRQTHARKAYASCLARLAEHSLLSRGAALALHAWEKQSELSRRVYRILRQPENGRAVRPASWVTSLLAVVLLAGAGELARVPQIVSFAPDQVQNASVATDSLAPAGIAPMGAHLQLARLVMPGGGPNARLETRPRAQGRAQLALLHPVELARGRPLHRTRLHGVVRARTILRMQVASAAVGLDQPHLAAQPLAAPPQWLVLTRSRPGNPAAVLRLAVEDSSSPSYAAVPFANGWLVFQL